MNQEIGIRTKFPFKLFHLTKSYDDILSDNEYLSRIRNLLSDINDRYPEFDLSYGKIFHSAYLICGLLTHPVYIQASFDEEFISYDMFEEIEKSLSIHPIDMPFVRCVVYLLLSRMDNPIRGTAYLVDELERELKKEIHIIERPYRYDRNRTREYHLNLTGILKEFNREYIKKYNFDFGVEPASSTLWNVEDIGFLMDISITPRELTIDFIYRFISYWPSLPERIKILNKIQAHFLNKDYLKSYDEEEINEVVEIVHCVMDGTLDRLKDEEKGTTEKTDTKVERFYNPFHSPTINIHHVDTLNNYHGECKISTVEKSESILSIKKEGAKDNSSEISHSPEDIIQYVMKLHPLYVSEKWKKYYRSLWEGVLQLPEVEAVIHDKGRQKNTTFNRNLVGNILCLMIDKGVLSGNATQITIALEGKEGASIRAQLGMFPTDKKLKESMIEIIETSLP